MIISSRAMAALSHTCWALHTSDIVLYQKM